MNHPGRSAQRTEAVDISKSRIAEELERSRRRVHALTACDEEELLKQHSPLMSPLVWDLAHVGSHEVHVPGYWIDTVPVSNAAFAEFVEDGGYDRPDRWSAAGWAHRQEAGLSAPRFWRREGGSWWRSRFGVVEPVPGDEPVQHASYWEAEACARWAGRRLPTEAEWEKAARWDPLTGRSRRFPRGDEDPAARHANRGGTALRPDPVGSYPDGASPLGVRQLMGDVWEWTSSGFHPYPGFRAFPYREYSEVFFGGDYKVLRDRSWATDDAACRGTSRNWDHPVRRQIFTGLRTARDGERD